MKLLYTFFSLLFFLFIGETDPQVVSIVHNLPSELKVGDRVLITLDIDKSTLSGFGLIELKFPDNCVVGAGDIGNASFTFENNKVRIVWMKMPDVPMLHVSYYLTYTGEPGVALDFHGAFSHIEDNYRVDEEIPSHPIITNDTETLWPVNSSQLAVIENITELQPESIPSISFTPQETIITDHNDAVAQTEFKSEEPVKVEEIVKTEEPVREVETIAVQEPVVTHQDVSSPETVTAVVTPDHKNPKSTEVLDQPIIPDRQDTPSDYPSRMIYFRVQLLAAHKTVNKSFLASTYGFKNEFNIEHHNGWLKYVTGMFETPELARAHRDYLNSSCHDLPGPFITAYHNGERISVQEALMLQSTAYRN